MQSSIEREEDYLRLLNLTIDGVTTAVDYVNNSYYLPIDMDAAQPARSKLSLAASESKIGDKKIKSGENIALSLNPGQNIEMEAGNNTIDKIRSCRLIVTGVPVIELSAPEGIEDENKRPCDIVLTDLNGVPTTLSYDLRAMPVSSFVEQELYVMPRSLSVLN